MVPACYVESLRARALELRQQVNSARMGRSRTTAYDRELEIHVLEEAIVLERSAEALDAFIKREASKPCDWEELRNALGVTGVRGSHLLSEHELVAAASRRLRKLYDDAWSLRHLLAGLVRWIDAKWPAGRQLAIYRSAKQASTESL